MTAFGKQKIFVSYNARCAGAAALSALACAAFLFAPPLLAASTPRPVNNSLTKIRQSPTGELERLRVQLDSSDVEQRRDAVLQLGTRRTPAASRLAAGALRDQRPIVRATAARAVLALPPDEAVAALVPLLKDRDEFVRREVAYALGATLSKTATTALVEALARDKQPGVRGAAAVALGQIKDPAATPALIAVISRRRTGRGLNRLLLRKEEENEFVRRAATVALGQIGDREAVETLITTLANEQTVDDVRREAARSLGLIGDPAAVAALRAALRAPDPYLSELARQALLSIEAVSSER